MLQHIGLTAMHGRVLIIKLHTIIPEDDTVRRNGVYERHAVGQEGIPLDNDIAVIALLLRRRFLYHGVNRYNAFRELITLNDVMVEQIVDDTNVQTTTAFIPALCITGQQNGRTAGAQESAALYQNRLGCGKQRTACAIVASVNLFL